MRFFVLCSLLYAVAIASTITPKAHIEASGSVQSIVYREGMILAGTNAGTLEAYRLSDLSKTLHVSFPKIKDFTGDEVTPKVFCVDALEGSRDYLAVVQASSGARALYLVEEGKPKVLIDASKNWYIVKARFIDSNRILIALLSNELVLWDVKNAHALYQTQLNPSHFSDFSLNNAKNKVACSCESGEISLVDVASGKVTKVLKGGNVDNVYKVDFQKSKVLCAGQDRRGIVYDTMSGAYERFDADFLIYAGALSPDERLGAFAFDEQNDIVIFDLAQKTALYTLRGQKSTLNTILFIDNHRLLSSSDDKTIMIWSIP
jgi:hypothetical protein